MSRGALLAGTAGGIIGTIASVLGIAWLLIYFLPGTPTFLFVPLGPSSLQVVISIIFMSLFLVACILTGIGFYGLYTIGGNSMGIVALIFCIIGGSSFLVSGLLGLFSQSWILIAIGFLIVLVSFIIIGAASISLREETTRPGVMLAAGILSIIGAILLGFIFLFVAFLLWAIAFYTTEA